MEGSLLTVRFKSGLVTAGFGGMLCIWGVWLNFYAWIVGASRSGSFGTIISPIPLLVMIFGTTFFSLGLYLMVSRKTVPQIVYVQQPPEQYQEPPSQ